MGRGPSLKTTELLAAAISILHEIQPCSVRAVCYRLFVAGHLDSMHKNETNKVSRVLTQARERGLISWDWIVDETREVEKDLCFDNPQDYLRTVRRWYRRDHWQLQPYHIEVWSEKGTIRGSIKPVLDELGVAFRVMHGYGSATAINSIAMDCGNSRKPWIVFYLGDFDPSGLHMSEVDLPCRLVEYGTHDNLDLRRLCLTEADVREGALPSFDVTTKHQDPRYRWYRETVRWAGSQAWELDAMNPVDLRTRLREAITDEMDAQQWNRSLAVEEAEQHSLDECFTNWNRILRQAPQ